MRSRAFFDASRLIHLSSFRMEAAVFGGDEPAGGVEHAQFLAKNFRKF